MSNLEKLKGVIVEALKLTPGLENMMRNYPKPSGRNCSECGFGLPKYPGRYPGKCPSCGAVLPSSLGVTVDKLEEPII